MKYSLRDHHNNRENPILRKSFELALGIIEYCEGLNQAKQYNMPRQLFRSGTSIGANIREAQHAESRADFLHKMKIAAKEAEETDFWLMLCHNSPSYSQPDHLFDLFGEVVNMLNAIIKTTKNRT